MTPDDIIEMARQAGYKDLPTVRLAFQGFDKVAFAKLVAAKEREACAIACETDGRDLAGLYYAGVIRARGES